jgi:predicted dehydrogenase
MPSKKINIGVVGLGFMGATHLRVYQSLPQARIVAVCDPSRQPVNGVLRGVRGNLKRGGDIPLDSRVKVYREFNELVAAPDVQLVDICTPTALHAAQAIAALQAGKHVLCEKPLAHNVSAARKVLRAAAAANTFLMPAMCMRFWPGWSWLKQVVTEQTYGAVLTAGFRRASARPAWGQAGTHLGGALLDLHIHDTDFVHFLFGRPAAVFSTGVTGVAGAVDHVVTQYYYPLGPVVQAEGGWLLPAGFNMGFTLHCERATIDFDFARGAGALRVQATENQPRTVKLKLTDGYQEEIASFLRSVAHGVSPSVVSPQDGLTALEICAAEEKSVRTGKLVQL